MSHPIKSALLMFFVNVVILVARHPVYGLKENEEVTDDFDTGTANFWQWFPGDGDAEENSTTFWHLSKHGDPPPFGIDAVRPPMEENGGGFLEIVPFSDSPAQIVSNVFDLLPYATLEMTYWNVVPFPILARNTVLILYLEFQNIDDSGTEPPLRTVQVFKAPLPTDPFPGWTTVTIDLHITEPSKVQFRIDGTRTDLPTTGLAVSKITIKNGLDVSTTTSTTVPSTTTETAGTSSTGTTPTPTKYAVDVTTPTTTTTTPTITRAPGATLPTDDSTTSHSSVTYYTTEESTVNDLPTEIITSDASSSHSSTSTSSPDTSPISTVTSSISELQMTITSSVSSSNSSSSTSTIPATTSTVPVTSGTFEFTSTSSVTTSSVTTSSVTTSSVTTSSVTTSSVTTSSVTTSSAFPTSPTTSASMSFTSTEPPPSGMTTNQLRDVLIGVGVAILLFFLFCLLFTIFYRRQRRRAYLIENRQLENGVIRTLEQLDQIPYTIHKNESDSSSISSTTASNCPLAPNPAGQVSVKDLLPNFLRSLSSTSSKITKLT